MLLHCEDSAAECRRRGVDHPLVGGGPGNVQRDGHGFTTGKVLKKQDVIFEKSASFGIFEDEYISTERLGSTSMSCCPCASPRSTEAAPQTRWPATWKFWTGDDFHPEMKLSKKPPGVLTQYNTRKVRPARSQPAIPSVRLCVSFAFL